MKNKRVAPLCIIIGGANERKRSQTTSAILGAQQNISKSLSQLYAMPPTFDVSTQQRTSSYSPPFRPPPYRHQNTHQVFSIYDRLSLNISLILKCDHF